MSSVHTLDASETAARLPFGALIAEVGCALLEAAAGALTTPERAAHPLPTGGTLLLMPAADERLLIVKCVTVFPANRERRLPTIQGDFLVKDAHTGRPLLALDAVTVTNRRTAALSALAVQTAAAATPSSALLIGAGAQARAHAEVFMEVLGIRRFLVAARTRESAARLASELEERGAEATTTADLRAAAADVDLVLAATTSTVPVVPVDVPDHVFVVAVGAFRRGMAELPAALLQRREVVVDTLEGARAEAGDLISAAEAGRWGWHGAVPLASLLAPDAPPAGKARLFKSVGHAAFDLAAARVAVRQNGLPGASRPISTERGSR